jgi:hypothetical protein
MIAYFFVFVNYLPAWVLFLEEVLWALALVYKAFPYGRLIRLSLDTSILDAVGTPAYACRRGMFVPIVRSGGLSLITALCGRVVLVSGVAWYLWIESRVLGVRCISELLGAWGGFSYAVVLASG